MRWELVKPWVNRVGIVLEFLSFWFAAPEILGEERLRALERRIEQGLRVLPSVVALGLTGVVVASVVMALGRAAVEGVVTWVIAVMVVAWVVVLVMKGTKFEIVAIVLENKIVLPLLRVLADDERIRQRSLAVGAVLFVVGFSLQLVATF